MRTLVVQSFRTHDVPEWIRLCLDSVQAWASARQFDYEFIDDSFFGYAPAWIKERCGAGNFYPVLDVARLYVLRDRLKNDRTRVVWFDADVLVFNPPALQIGNQAGYAFCHEIVLAGPLKKLSPAAPSLSNAAMVFEKGNPMLDFYLFAVEQIVRHRKPETFSRMMLGPELLSNLQRVMPLARLVSIGLFTPPLMAAYANRGYRSLPEMYRRAFGYPLAAANLCQFVRHEAAGNKRAYIDAVFLEAVHRLLQSAGEIANPPIAPSPPRAPAG